MSDTDDSAVTTGQTILNELNCLEKIKEEIEKCKTAHTQLLKDQKELCEAKDELWELAERFHQRCEKLREDMEEEEKEQKRRMDALEVKAIKLQQEQDLLRAGEQQMKEELEHTDKLAKKLRQQTQMSEVVPEKRLVFAGDTSNEAEALDLNCRIVYPMEGGTALLTFEDEKVAQRVLALQKHVIQLGNCSFTIEAKPVQFLIPSHIEMDIHVCPRSILISNLPVDIDDESRLLDRLEVHFCKTRNGGGEVETICMLEDSSNVVITFLNGVVTKDLVDKQFHDVEMAKKKLRVRVTPFLNGEMTTLQTQVSMSKHTVLLTGIPSVMDQDTMQDNLEIHFQKSSNGGGEISAIAFNPVGLHKLAVVEDDNPANHSA